MNPLVMLSHTLPALALIATVVSMRSFAFLNSLRLRSLTHYTPRSFRSLESVVPLHVVAHFEGLCRSSWPHSGTHLLEKCSKA